MNICSIKPILQKKNQSTFCLEWQCQILFPMLIMWEYIQYQNHLPTTSILQYTQHDVSSDLGPTLKGQGHICFTWLSKSVPNDLILQNMLILRLFTMALIFVKVIFVPHCMNIIFAKYHDLGEICTVTLITFYSKWLIM